MSLEIGGWSLNPLEWASAIDLLFNMRVTVAIEPFPYYGSLCFMYKSQKQN